MKLRRKSDAAAATAVVVVAPSLVAMLGAECLVRNAYATVTNVGKGREAREAARAAQMRKMRRQWLWTAIFALVFTALGFYLAGPILF